jgi:ABC-type transport system involved in multi-copper enzyme maturation permease subunit
MSFLPLILEAAPTESPLPLILALLVALAGIIALWVTTKVGPIAKNTFIETIRQPVVLLLVLIAVVLTIFSGLMPMYTLRFEADAKMVKDMGFSTATLCGMLVAFFGASATITDEFDKKTALTVLSKPVSRVEFILGKYLGIMGTVVLAILVLVVTLWATLGVKSWTEYYIFEREVEAAVHDVTPEQFEANLSIARGEFAGMSHALKKIAREALSGGFLVLLQVGVLAAISVAVATRLPIVINIVLCLAVFVFGHVGGQLNSQIRSVEGVNPILGGLAGLITVIFPNLENLNLSWYIAEGSSVQPIYMVMCLGYAVIYVTAALLIATYSLNRKDIA